MEKIEVEKMLNEGSTYGGQKLRNEKVFLSFLEDENGPVQSLDIGCLKPDIGQENILESVWPFAKTFRFTIL